MSQNRPSGTGTGSRRIIGPPYPTVQDNAVVLAYWLVKHGLWNRVAGVYHEPGCHAVTIGAYCNCGLRIEWRNEKKNEQK